jgi:YHS domain-containing protein
MKKYFSYLVLLISSNLFSQNTEYNLKNGYVAEGYDVVSYFQQQVTKGNKQFTANFDGVKFQFSSKENLVIFNKNPTKYIPQYGGFCAYAIGKNGEKVSINPKTFEIREGKLYLFYNSWGTNTLELWQKEDPKKLQQKADENWKKIVKS